MHRSEDSVRPTPSGSSEFSGPGRITFAIRSASLSGGMSAFRATSAAPHGSDVRELYRKKCQQAIGKGPSPDYEVVRSLEFGVMDFVALS